ncbi:ABC transporter permease [Janibacter cremeus]|uniref:NitT/TauT family transport system permease protein n=1 Tax=Janibacter cremeus TaxID=1285192 RepID=A0A852VWZ4_9MICO|nr:ABC transporter permease [Janibacter cremeus]NYF98051.1 NitT/TauT family transport system permease protein [Janibacter cremeus]
MTQASATDSNAPVGTAGSDRATGASIVSRLVETLRASWPAIALIVIIVAAWQAISAAGLVETYVLPSPWSIVHEMVADFDLYWRASLPTLTAILLGFAISVLIALPIAIGMVYSPLLQRAIYPLLVLSQVVPKVALAPLFIIWFGFGTPPKIFMVVLIAFFPLVVDAVVGFQAARPESLMLVRSMGASRWQAFWKVRFPWALPSIFAGAKVAITLAVVGAVVAEFVGADQGLGVVITQARGNLDTVAVFAGIGFLSIIGLILFACVSIIERVLVRGSRSGRSFEAAGSL